MKKTTQYSRIYDSDRRTIIALSSACALFAILAFLLARYDPYDYDPYDMEESATPLEITKIEVMEVTAFPPSEIGAIAVTNVLTSYGLMNYPTEIMVISNVSGDWSQSDLRAFVYAACHLTASRRLPDASPAEYLGSGTDSPLAKVTLIKSDGTRVNFSILSRNETSGEYYLFFEEQQILCMITAADAEIFLQDERAFLSHPIFPAISLEDIGRVSVVSVDFLRPSDGRDYTVERVGNAFFVTSPILRRVSTSAVMETLLRPLSSIRSNSNEPENDLEGTGWDLRILMAADGTEYAATVVTRDGRVVVKDEKSGRAFSSKTVTRPAFYGSYMSIVGSRAVYYPAGDVSRLRVEWGEKSFSADRGENWESGGDSGAKAMRVLRALNGLEILSVAVPRSREDMRKDLEEDLFRVTLDLTSGETDTIIFVLADAGLRHVVVNGIANFATSEAAFERLKNATSH
ncbi:MAG: DUF4340 domain-containing protein [Synergistaceae bacterium]|jgi:hypothetical protein|nr:DUF4340 domain-containing protein [Synergistaceae bacterium]